jgi:hypothetical protein
MFMSAPEIDSVVSQFLIECPGLVRPEQIRAEIQAAPHRALQLPTGWQGIYAFRYQGIWLKVGKAGPNSNARWQSQHYNPGAAMSNLAWSLLRYAQLAEIEDPRLSKTLKARIASVGPGAIGDWIKQNTDRCNILLEARLGRSALSDLETLAIEALAPVFEGRWMFGGS